MHSRTAIATATAVVFLAYGHVALEWLFFATTPSFLVAAPMGHRLAALAVAPLPAALFLLAIHGLAVAAARGLAPRARFMLRLVPALACACIALVLVDNFTYTVFGLSLARATWARILYVLGFTGIVWRLAGRRAEAAEDRIPGLRVRVAVAAGLLLVSGLTFGALKWASDGRSDPIPQVRAKKATLPNIVFFAADGVNAARTSAYGYHRETTPHLDARLQDALVFDNAFTNSARTTGSVTSMVTGKHPATTKVLFPPYILQGDDAYQTLPRLLRKLGYRTIQESVRYYADGPDLNWRESFHFANDRWIVGEVRAFEPELQLANTLIDVISARLSERLLHMVGIKAMRNPYDQVAGGRPAKVYGVSDDDRMRRVFAFIEESLEAGDGPFFAHIHLMETHCCTFRPKEPHFSAGTFASEAEWKEAAFDDTIREADARFGALMEFLERRGVLDDTLVVYSSDHTRGWDLREQVPLAFFFPDKAHRGRRSTPAQLLDVTPTVLDYLGIEAPDWLEGTSLLREDLPKDRPFFAVASLRREGFRTDQRDHLTRVKQVGPPTYGLTEMGMVVCQRWYAWKIEEGTVELGEVPAFRDGCDPETLPSRERAREMMERHLRERGFAFPGADAT
ncbi:MAG TPA: sulfatase-like hydrolase/transferase [Fredinandcohnia sp.]|nr:sulfatase-like hydrolase/transferase [Fredinandcohnia sp.]